MSCVVDIHPRLPNFKICQEPDDFFIMSWFCQTTCRVQKTRRKGTQCRCIIHKLKFRNKGKPPQNFNSHNYTSTKINKHWGKAKGLNELGLMGWLTEHRWWELLINQTEPKSQKTGGTISENWTKHNENVTD